MLYLPRNVRSHRLYGFSPVEQIALTINIALRREQATLDYYNTGSIPDSFATLPKDWTVDQIRQFQDYFDALMSGNLARRRMVKFMPADFKLTETRQPPLKDQYDEWLARVICYAFSVPASAFVSQVNRATSETLRAQAATEGLVPLKAWVKMMLDRVVQVCLKAPDLEFAWVGDDAVDPLQQAQTIAILVNAGIKTRDEARVELGLTEPPGVAKFNPYHDPSNGQFTTAEGAGSPNENLIHPVADPRNRYSVNLSEEEKRGGHAIDRHVNRSADSLLQEAGIPIKQTLDGTVYRAVGAFSTLSDANNLTNRVLESNSAAVDAVASGTEESAWLVERFGYPTGKEAVVLDDSGTPTIRPTYYVGVSIFHDPQSPNGYTVRTAYPLNNYPGELHL